MSVDLRALNFGKIVEAVQSEITTVSATVKDKTLNRFMRPIVISCICAFASYYLVYAPPQAKFAGLQRRLDASKKVSEYADNYKGIHEELAASFDKLPQPKDRERWITDTLVEAMKADGLIADSIIPPDENVSQGFAAQKVSVALTAKFSEVYALVRRLERSKPVMHVEAVHIEKVEHLEMNSVNCTFGTIIPLQKAQ